MKKLIFILSVFICISMPYKEPIVLTGNIDSLPNLKEFRFDSKMYQINGTIDSLPKNLRKMF